VERRRAGAGGDERRDADPHGHYDEANSAATSRALPPTFAFTHT
jgi:hypothetical protein